MTIPKRPVNLVDLLEDIEACYKVVLLEVDHGNRSYWYDDEDVDFVDPELFECLVESYEVKKYTKRKVAVHIILKGE